jgi:hypothetical protein
MVQGLYPLRSHAYKLYTRIRIHAHGLLILTHSAHEAYSLALTVMTFFPLQRQLVPKLVHLDNDAEDPIHLPRRGASKECLIEPECVELLMNWCFCMLCPGLSQEQRHQLDQKTQKRDQYLRHPCRPDVVSVVKHEPPMYLSFMR